MAGGLFGREEGEVAGGQTSCVLSVMIGVFHRTLFSDQISEDGWNG